MAEEERRSFVRRLQETARAKEQFDRDWDLYNSLDRPQQKYLSYLSSHLLEPDVYNDYRTSQQRRQGVVNALTRLGLEEDKIRAILNFYHLEDPRHPLDQKGI